MERLTNFTKKVVAVPKSDIESADSDESIFAVDFNQMRDPRGYREAMESENRDEWVKAFEKEKESQERMQTWELISFEEVPKGKRIIDSSWVCKTKTGESGEILSRKARLVARGDRQQEGIDYHETFAPTLRSETLRYIIS